MTLTPKLYRLILEKSPLLPWYTVPQDTGSGLSCQGRYVVSTHCNPAAIPRSSLKPSCIGGIGVSRSGPWYINLELARVGLKYIQDRLWAKK